MSDDLHINEKSRTQKEDVIKRNTKEVKLSKENLDINYYGNYYIPEFNGKRLTIKNINEMPMEEREEAAKFVFDFYRTNGFPYPKFSDQELIDDFNKLKEFNSNQIENNKKISTGSSTGICLFKHFSETFYEAKEKKSRSLLEAFNDDKILMEIIRNRLGITFFYRGVSFPFNILGNQIRQGARSTRKAATTSVFKPTVAKYFVEKYSNENDIVYDYSIGFGQRILGTVSSNKNLTYIGCDPWEKSMQNNMSMVDFLDNNFGNIKNKVKINICGSENYCPNELIGKVGLSISSPPYHSTEVYDNGNITQAYSNRNYDEFINIWWKKVSDNISKLTKPRGYFIINMIEKINKNNNILNDMLDIMKKNEFEEVDRYYMVLSKSHLSGKVGKENENDLKKLEPIVVMRKC